MADAATISVLLSAKDEASAKLKTVGDNMGRLGQNFQKHGKAIGLGMLAVGAGIEVLAKQQQELTESTRKLSYQTGLTEGDIRKLATELSNATFPLQSAIDLMMLGARQGLETGEALQQYANFWDMIGDATGGSAEKMAEMGASLAALGIEVGEESRLLEAFGLIQTTTTGSVQNFIKTVSMLAPELAAMGLSVNDVAVILTAMERELGQAGRIAITEFREALEKSETGLTGVLELLGLTETQLDTYRVKLEESGKVMMTQAELYASTKTSMDNLKSAMEDLAFANGALIEKAAALAPLLLALPPAVTGATIAYGLLEPVILRARLAFIGLNLSMGVIAAIIIGISVAITAAILVWKNWDKVVEIAKKGLALFVKAAVGYIKIWLEAAKAIVSWIPGLDSVEEKIQSGINTLDGFSDKINSWATDSGNALEQTGDAWGAMEDQHHSVSDGVIENNVRTGASTVDLEQIVGTSTASMVQSHVGLQRATEMTAEAAELGWGAVEDAVVQAQGGTIKSLDEIIRAQEDLESSLDSNLDRIRSNMDATNIQWNKTGKEMEDVVQAWADIMDMEIEDVLARMDELNVDTENVKATLNTFTDETGRNFFTWADNVDEAAKQAALSLKNTEATLQTQMDKYKDVLVGGFNVEALSMMGWGEFQIENAMAEQVKKLEEAEQRLADRMANIGGREEEREAGSRQRNIHALGMGTGQTTVLGAFQTIQESAKWGSPSHRTKIKEMTEEAILDAILESAGAEAALGSHDAIRAAGLADLFGLDKKQRGGLSKGGLTLVGESGPEIVNLPGGSFVHPNGTSPGGVTNQFHFHGAVYGVEDLKEAVVEAVRDHAISGGFSGVFAEA